MKQRTLYFDILRIISCVMIVLMHSQKTGVGTPGWVLAGMSYVEAAGIGLFFMISGALMLNRDIEVNDNGVWQFLWNRIKKIGVPLLTWNCLYSFAGSIGFENTGRGVLWFLWTILGLYLLTPILTRWLRMASDKEVMLYLGIWGVSLLYPEVNLFFEVSTLDTSWVYYFHGYVGYYVLGYYLGRRVGTLSNIVKAILGGAFFVTSVCTPLIVLFLKLEIDFYSFFWYLSLPVVLQCVMWFLCMKRMELLFLSCTERMRNAIHWLAEQTFGIYLMHILIMRGWLWKTEWMESFSGITHMVICAMVTFYIAMCVTAIVKRVPYLNWIVGIPQYSR